MTSRQQRRAQQRQTQKQAIRPVPAAPTTPATASSSKFSYTALIESAPVALLLSSEEAAAYRAHLRQVFEHHVPEPGLECQVVQRLADLQWRIRRIAQLESGFVALFRRKYAELFPEDAGAVRTALIDAHAQVAEGLSFKRLGTQEAHLRRFYAKDLAELAALQHNRTEPQVDTPLTLAASGEIGFEFSNPEFVSTPGFEFPELAGALSAPSSIESTLSSQ